MNTEKKVTFKSIFAEVQATDAYWVETCKLSITGAFCRQMERTGVSRADLARKLGVSQAYVSVMLGGGENLTIETMVKVSRALGLRLYLTAK